MDKIKNTPIVVVAKMNLEDFQKEHSPMAKALFEQYKIILPDKLLK